MNNAYDNLNDVAERHGLLQFLPGKTEIYYLRNGDSVGGERAGVLAQFGLAQGRPWHPTTGQFNRLWDQVGKIACTDLEEIFALMQGEIWSPNGEARLLVRGLGMDHTSMSVGDIVFTNDNYWICRRNGWEAWDEN